MIIENVLRNKLHDELCANGINPKSVDAIEGTKPIGASITFEEGTDMELVQQIIDNHDPTPLPPPLSDKERIEELEQIVADLILGQMEVY